MSNLGFKYVEMEAFGRDNLYEIMNNRDDC
jgi:hypothetical protein